MSDTERWERRSATVGADEKDAWLERAAAEGWELVAVVDRTAILKRVGGRA